MNHLPSSSSWHRQQLGCLGTKTLSFIPKQLDNLNKNKTIEMPPPFTGTGKEETTR